MGFPDSSIGKESACNAGDPSFIPGQEEALGLLLACNAGDPSFIPGQEEALEKG